MLGIILHRVKHTIDDQIDGKRLNDEILSILMEALCQIDFEEKNERKKETTNFIKAMVQFVEFMKIKCNFSDIFKQK